MGVRARRPTQLSICTCAHGVVMSGSPADAPSPNHSAKSRGLTLDAIFSDANATQARC
jgi:hypothetical protein